MKPFSLEEYLANPTRKVVTRDGRDVRIVCTDVMSQNFPVVGVVSVTKSVETAMQFTAEGKALTSHCYQQDDLFFASIKHEGWINIHRAVETDYLSGIYSSKELAEEDGKLMASYVATIRIEWEE